LKKEEENIETNFNEEESTEEFWVFVGISGGK